MVEKLIESIKQQKEQLMNLLQTRDQLEIDLETVTNNIHQLKGSIAALEYVKTLQPTTDKTEDKE